MSLSSFLLGLAAVANVGELCDAAGGRVDPEEVVVPDEIDPVPFARDAHG